MAQPRLAKEPREEPRRSFEAADESTPLRGDSASSSSAAAATAEDQEALIAHACTVLGELISGLPFSPCHYNLFGAVALVWVAGGAFHAVYPWVLADAKQEYELDPPGEAALVGCLYAGRLLSLVSFSLLADALGRWPVVFWSLTATLGWCFALNGSSGSGIVALGVCIFAAGWLECIPYNTAKMLLAESLPAPRRGLLLNLCHAFWQGGAALLAAATLVATTTPFLALVVLGPIVAALVAFAAIGVEESPLFGVRESPLWLLRARGSAAADVALSRLATKCGVPRPKGATLPPTPPPPPPRCVDWWRVYRVLFSPRLRRLTLTVTLMRACLMVGMAWELFLVNVLSRRGTDTTLASTLSLTMYASKLGGCLLGALLVDTTGRRPLLCACFFGVSAADLALSFLLPPHHGDDGSGNAWLYVTLAAMYASAEVCWSTTASYINEAFPTAARAPAIAFSNAAGTLLAGVFSVCGPLLLATIGAPALLRICGCFMLGGGLLALTLQAETAGRPLE